MIAALHPRPSALVSAVVAALVLVCTSSAAGAVDANEWKNRQEMTVAAAGLTKVLLPTETLDLARENFADLRIVGPNQQEVPYVLDVPKPSAPTVTPVRHFRVELQKVATLVTIETGVTGAVDGIVLETPAHEFVKAARLEISTDGKSWELVSEGIQLARGRQLDQRTIRFNTTVAPFIRLTIDDWRTPVVPFTAASVLVASQQEAPSIAVDAQISKRDEFAGETVLTLSLPRHLPLAAVEFDVGDRIFSRSVRITERRLVDGEAAEQLLASGFISRYQSARQTLREQRRMPLNVSPSSREIEVHIENGNNAPLAIERVNLWRRPVSLTFLAEAAGVYVILTGRSDIAAPNYDLAVFGDDVRMLAETPITISPAVVNAEYRPSDRLAQTPLLGATLDIAQWSFRKNVSVVSPGVQELELDPDVLAHAQSGLGDLRLMSDGHQIPYLLERTSLSRMVSLAPTPADDPKQPSRSRWTVELPVERLPITRLVMTSNTVLFSRTVQIFETIRDDRGETFRRPLSSQIQWNVTPDRPDEKSVAVSISTPQTKLLEIEVDNGDNPPIALAKVAAEYPVVRLLFRSGSQPIQLHYGHGGARAPRYDLQLVSGYLVNQERRQANVGPEERIGSEPGRIFLGLRGGVALWAALGLVVVVLLVVIARLLPKPAEAKTE